MTDNYVLALEPHNDDVALFSAFNAWRHRPTVVTVLRSYVQERRGTGITFEEREAETELAMRILGCPHEQWEFRDDAPDWAGVEEKLRFVRDELSPDLVLAPHPEPEGGHDHHDQVGLLARAVFGTDQIVEYLTYTNGHDRSVDGAEVDPSPGAVQAKLRALACYGSQIELPSTGHWFLRELREYVSR